MVSVPGGSVFTFPISIIERGKISKDGIDPSQRSIKSVDWLKLFSYFVSEKELRCKTVFIAI